MLVPVPYKGGSNLPSSIPYADLEDDIQLTKTKVEHFEMLDCTACILHERGKRVVPGYGNANAKYMIVSQAPSRWDDAGQRDDIAKEMERLLVSAGISLSECYFTNLVKHYPGRNALGKDNKPGKKAMSQCGSHWLQQEIELVEPEVIITLGAVAINYFLPGEKITEAHGQVLEYEDMLLVPMYHPSAGAQDLLRKRSIFYDFTNLPKKLRQMRDGGQEQLPYTHIPFIHQEPMYQINEMLHSMIAQDGPVAFDFETTGLRTWTDRVVGVAVSFGDSNYYISCTPDGVSDVLMMNALTELWDTPGLIAHNAKFELGILKRYGITPVSKINDTYQLAHILNKPEKGLKALALQEFGYKMTPITDLIGTGVNEINMSDVPAEQAAPYAAADTHFTLRLWNLFSSQAEEWVWTVYNEIEQHMPDIAVGMEHEGFELNATAINTAATHLATMSDEHEREVRTIVGDSEFNIGSAPQVLKYFRDSLGATAIQVPNTNATTLQRVAADFPFGLKIVEGRHLRKLAGSYVSGLEAILPKAYSSYNPLGTQTGRFSSSGYRVLGHTIDGKKRQWGLNFQTIPKPKPWEDEDNAESNLVRRCIIADSPNSECCGIGVLHSHTLIEADYSQVELRVQADQAMDKNMIQAYLDNQDLHQLTQDLCELDRYMPKADDDSIRRVAKVINFALQYEPDDRSAAYVLKRTCAQASVFLDDNVCARIVQSKREAYPDVTKYYADIKQLLQDQGFVETQMGRRLYLPWLPGYSRQVKRVNDESHRKGVNMPIQGTAADIMKMALIKLWNTQPSWTVIKNTVHDSVVYQVPEEKVHELQRWAQPIMEDIWTLAVPIKVDFKAGPNLADMGKING